MCVSIKASPSTGQIGSRTGPGRTETSSLGGFHRSAASTQGSFRSRNPGSRARCSKVRRRSTVRRMRSRMASSSRDAQPGVDGARRQPGFPQASGPAPSPPAGDRRSVGFPGPPRAPAPPGPRSRIGEAVAHGMHVERQRESPAPPHRHGAAGGRSAEPRQRARQHLVEAALICRRGAASIAGFDGAMRGLRHRRARIPAAMACLRPERSRRLDLTGTGHGRQTANVPPEWRRGVRRRGLLQNVRRLEPGRDRPLRTHASGQASSARLSGGAKRVKRNDSGKPDPFILQRLHLAANAQFPPVSRGLPS